MDSYRSRLEADLKVAELVHRSLIPASRREGDLEIVCEFIPMIGVGGDYASIYFQTDRRCVVGICDVAGHGVASALLATRVNSFVLSQAASVRHPCQLVEALNDFVYRTFRDTNLYLTFFSLVVDLERETIVGSGCGHPPVLLHDKQNDVVRRLESENTVIGLFDDLSRTCSMLEIPFKRGDRLILYTDGLIESTNDAGLVLGVDGLEGCFKEFAHLPLAACVEAICRRVNDFREGVPADDDQLLLAISYLERSGAETGAHLRVDGSDVTPCTGCRTHALDRRTTGP